MAGLAAQFGDDDLVCMEFDLACQMRLQIEETATMQLQAKLIAHEVSKLFSEEK